MKLYQLAIQTLIHQKTWVVAAILLVVAPWVLPHFTPIEYNRGLLEPARAQAAWGISWFLALTWGMFHIAQLGDHFRKSGLASYFKVQGVNSIQQLGQCALVILTMLTPLALCSCLICIIGACPKNPIEAQHWIFLNLQSVLLFLLILTPVLLYVYALSSRFGSTAGFSFGLGLMVYGMWGVGLLESMLSVRPSPLMETLWTLSPHYHLGDMTPRFVFKMGAVAAGDYMQLLGYFTILLALTCGATFLTYRSQPNVVKA